MTVQEPGYAYIWEYLVRPECTALFREEYGPEGTWVKLFRRAKGYVRTELHRNRKSPNRFLIIDYWDSVETWKAFRTEMASEFETLDTQCETFTLEEREIGRYEPLC